LTNTNDFTANTKLTNSNRPNRADVLVEAFPASPDEGFKHTLAPDGQLVEQNID
jgi:hypothetical protein|tara:strand:+ start:715 stop:876 length:162 start_codon:yes stop_codon:yes gene_type:complete